MSDLISRQAAKNKKVYSEERHEYVVPVAELDWLPSAEPERMRGKWIRITQGATPEKYICPFCHREVENHGIEELLPFRYPFCHCGADMRGVADNDNN